MPAIEIVTIIIAIIAWPSIVIVYYRQRIRDWLNNRYGRLTPPPSPASSEEAIQPFSFQTSKKAE